MPTYHRARSRRIAQGKPDQTHEKAVLDERWHVALYTCSVRALERAFEASKDDDGYQLGEFVLYSVPVAVRHISQSLYGNSPIGISIWLVDFSETSTRLRDVGGYLCPAQCTEFGNSPQGQR